MAYRDVVLSDRPWAYWPLHDMVGATALDIAGQGLHGTIFSGGTNVLLGKPGTIVGEPGAAMFFNNNVAGYITSTAGISATAGTAFSVEFWLYFTATTNGEVIAGRDAGSFGWEIQVSNSGGANPGKIAFVNNAAGGFVLYEADGTYTGPALNDGRFHHVVCVATGTRAYIYTDGVLVDDRADNGARTATAATIYIGKNGRDNAVPYSGSLSHVALYRSVLSTARVLAHYRAGVGMERGLPRRRSRGP